MSLTFASQTTPLSRVAVKRWLQVVSHTDSKYGGLSSAVPALGRHLAEKSTLDITLHAFCAPGEQTTPSGFSQNNLTFWPTSRIEWLSRYLRSRFTTRVRQADGVHIHGLWETSTAVAAHTCRQLGVPYILSAHGMLEPWALASSRAKKLLYSAFLEKGNLQGAACLHALTHMEARQYIRYGARSPIAVIPNGVDLLPAGEASVFFNRHPYLLGKRIILFLARLHPKKGLDLLVNSWRDVASSWPEAHLVLAGPDSLGTQADLEKFIARHHLQKSITFTGMLGEQGKQSAFAAAECFILPSHSEGLSVSVLEAMGAGLPVILTEGCNMPEVAESNAGWQIKANANAITAALNQVLQNPRENNHATGLRGAHLIRERYSWPKVASQMEEVYSWVNGGPTPSTTTLIHP